MNHYFVPITKKEVKAYDYVAEALNGLTLSFMKTLSLVNPDECLPSDSPYVIDAYNVDLDDDLLDMNAHKRQRIEDSAVYIYNLL